MPLGLWILRRLLRVERGIAVRTRNGFLEGFQFFRGFPVLRLQPRHFDFRSHEISNHSDQLDIPAAVKLSLAVLDIDYSHQLFAAHHGHGEECLEAVFRQLIESLKPRILLRLSRDRDGFLVLRHPTGDALPYFNAQAID
jgi:hypothetical protein